MVSKLAESWRPVVVEEMNRAGVPLPVDLVLTLLDLESGGVAGAVNPKSGASGLMQVMPGTLKDYNKKHAVAVSLAELRGKSPAAGRLQIRVGVWVLSMFWRGAYRYILKRSDNVPTDDLARIADLYYVAGPGATRRRLDKAPRPTFDAVSAMFPSWAALRHPRNIFKRLDEQGGVSWRLDDIADWLHSTALAPPGRRPVDGFVIASIGVLLAWWWMKKKGKQHGKKERQEEKEN